MKILLLNSAKQWGGNEHWLNLAANALKKKHNIILAYRNNVIGDRFSVKKIRLPFISELDIYTILKLILLVKTYKIDLILPTKRKDYALAAIISKLTGLKNVLRIGIVRHYKNTFINQLIYNNSSDGIIVNADEIRKQLISDLNIHKEKIFLLHNGINTEEINQKTKEYKPEKKYKFQILYCGEISERKGIDFLLKSFQNYLHKFEQENHSGLVLIGSGKALNKFKDLSNKLGIHKNVVFTGKKENPYPYFKISDLFLMPSKSEGISNSVLEAIYLNIPVISTSSSGDIESLIKKAKAGFIVPFGDIETLSNKIYVSQKSKNEEMVENAHNKVISAFNLKNMEKKLLEFIANI